MQKKNDDLDAFIHRGLVELGLLIPITEDEVEWAEKAMERDGIKTELPESLKEPPFHLLEKIQRIIMSKELLKEHSDQLTKAAAIITAAAPKSGNAFVSIVKKVLPSVLPFLPGMILELAPKLRNKKNVKYLDETIAACEQLKAEIEAG